MRNLASFITLLVVVASAYFFVFDSRSSAIVDLYRPAPPARKKTDAQAVLLPVPGDRSVQKVILKPKAAERVGIATAPVAEETVKRVRSMTGLVEQTGGGLQLAVELSGRTDVPTPGQPGLIRTAGSPGGAITAVAVGAPSTSVTGETVAKFDLPAGGHVLKPGDRVVIEVPIGDGGKRKVVPRSAVVYDPKGGAWVFVSREPLTFVRTRIKVDFIEGERAVLVEGPAPGTIVASGGVTEIFGTEGKIGAVGLSASF